MESTLKASLAIWCVVYTSMIVEALGAASEEEATGRVSAITPVVLIAFSVFIVAVAAVGISRAHRRQPPTPSNTDVATASTTIDVSALAPPSFTLTLDEDSILNFDDEEDEEEEDEATKKEAETRRLGNLALVLKQGKYFRSNYLEEFPYSPRQCRRTASSSSQDGR